MAWFWILVVALVAIYAILLVYTHKRKRQMQMRRKSRYFKERILIVGMITLFGSQGLLAQDIIHTSDSKQIEAKVLEVSDDEVSYKMFNNLDGPIFKMVTSKIIKIVFENGTEYAFVEEVANHGLPLDATIEELTAKGNNVLLIFKDLSGNFDEKDAYLKEFLREDGRWNLVEAPAGADFILYVEGYSKRTARSFASDTYFMTPTIRRMDNTAVWTGKEVSAYANAFNGYRAVKAVSKELIEDSLFRALEKRQ